MLSNAYLLANFRFDAAENEPAKNLQNFRKCMFEKCIFELSQVAVRNACAVDTAEESAARAAGLAAFRRAGEHARQHLRARIVPNPGMHFSFSAAKMFFSLRKYMCR